MHKCVYVILVHGEVSRVLRPPIYERVHMCMRCIYRYVGVYICVCVVYTGIYALYIQVYERVHMCMQCIYVGVLRPPHI